MRIWPFKGEQQKKPAVVATVEVVDVRDGVVTVSASWAKPGANSLWTVKLAQGDSLKFTADNVDWGDTTL